MGGVVAGLERWEDDCHLIGAYGAYIGSNVDATNDQNATLNGGQFGAYLFGDDGFNYYTLLGGVGFDDNTTNRTLTFMSPASANSSNTSDWQAFLYAERGVSPAIRQLRFATLCGIAVFCISSKTDSPNPAAMRRSICLAAATPRIHCEASSARDSRMLKSITVVFALCRNSMLCGCTNAWIPARVYKPPWCLLAGAPFIVQGLDMGRDWAVLGGNYTWGNAERLEHVRLTTIYNSIPQATYNIGSRGVGYSW